jgi:sugar phosphate isomerase/epimerase
MQEAYEKMQTLQPDVGIQGFNVAIVSRREFSKIARNAAAFGLWAGSAVELGANPLDLPLGCQTYPVRKMIAHDFPGTLKQLSGAGFQVIELCSPVGYADSGFGVLAQYKPPELRSILRDANLQCVSSHFSIDELRKDMPGRIEWAQALGLTQMLVPSLDGPKNPTSDDVKSAADEYNKLAEQSAKAGIQQGLHNDRRQANV